MDQLQVEYRPLAALVPYSRNARTHDEAQVEALCRSLREFGWTNPVLVDGANGIIAGHGRVLAAAKLGMAEVPCIELRNLSPEQRRAYILADNQLALRAGWDPEALRFELSELQALQFPVDALGFTSEDMARILDARPAGLTDPDEAPEAPANPVATTGDLWALGRHRLLCGDATCAEDTQKVLAGVSPHLMVTDPPYGVDYDPDWRNRADRANGKPYGASAIGLVTNDKRTDWSDAWSLFPGDVAYAWHPPGAMQVAHYEALVKAGFEVRMQIIWAKQHFPIGRGNYHVQHEPCWYAVRKGKTGHWTGDRKQSTLWQIDKPMKSETGHSTQKPVECMKRPIENNSSPGQAVYEPFSGSGTTIIAAEMTGRACYAIEIAPAYVDVAIVRWQNFTGLAATLDGKAYDEVKAERQQQAA